MPSKFDVAQRLHDLVHVVVAVIHEGLDEVRQRRADVAEVDLPDLRGAEVADHLLGVLAGELAAAFEPGAAAEADADVRAVGDLQGPLVAVEVAEDAARHAGEHGHRRVVGMDADPHAGLFGDRGHLLDEVGVVVPDLFLRELAAVGERLLPGLAVPDALLVRGSPGRTRGPTRRGRRRGRCSRCRCPCGRRSCSGCPPSPRLRRYCLYSSIFWSRPGRLSVTSGMLCTSVLPMFQTVMPASA